MGGVFQRHQNKAEGQRGLPPEEVTSRAGGPMVNVLWGGRIEHEAFTNLSRILNQPIKKDIWCSVIKGKVGLGKVVQDQYMPKTDAWLSPTQLLIANNLSPCVPLLTSL